MKGTRITATFNAIGAVKDVELGYFHADTHEYDRHRLDGEWELIHCAGNISLKEGEPFVHAHVVVSGPDLSCRAGHLFNATVAVTAEVHLLPLGVKVERKLDDETGIALLDLPDL